MEWNCQGCTMVDADLTLALYHVVGCRENKFKYIAGWRVFINGREIVSE